MQVTETSAEGLSREFQIIISQEDLDSRLNTHLESIKGQVHMKGFRPGKVPVSFLKKTYGKSMMGDVVQEAMNESTQKAIEDNDLRPAVSPKVEVEGSLEDVVEKGADLKFSMAVELMPDFELPDFAEIELAKPVAPVQDSQIDEALERIAQQNQSFTPRDEGAKAEDGDALTVDFKGTIDGEAFEGGEAEDIQIVLGKGQFIPGFEEQLVGAKVGDNKTVKVTFPEDYGAENLAGKDAEFDVDVKIVSAPDDAAMDDEFAKKLGLDSLDKLKEALSEQIEREHQQLSRARLKRNLLDKLDELHSFDLPKGMVDAEFNQIWSQFEQSKAAEQEPESPEDEKPEEELKEEYKAIAERRVRLGLVLAETGRINNINVAQEELNRAIAEQARQFPGQEQQIFEFYSKSPEALAQMRAPLFEDKVVDFIVELAKITDEEVSREDLLKEPEDEE